MSITKNRSEKNVLEKVKNEETNALSLCTLLMTERQAVSLVMAVFPDVSDVEIPARALIALLYGIANERDHDKRERLVWAATNKAFELTIAHSKAMNAFAENNLKDLLDFPIYTERNPIQTKGETA